jgi:peroxiredoxin
MAATPPVCEFGWRAPDFNLPATDGRSYTLADVAGERGTLIMFICNHCPYVQAVLTRILRDARDLSALGIGIAAISSNDVVAYPEDSFENMKALAEEESFPFPYLFDETQEVARAYRAVCTPDFFGFNKDGELQYRGRLDASNKAMAPFNARRELFEAMAEVAKSGKGPAEQVPSIGCSIKWREERRRRA